MRSQKLTLSVELTAAACDHASYMARTNNMNHYVNGDPASRAQKYGYQGRYVRENIAMGQGSVASVMNTWYNSSGHRANMLSNYRFAGFGCAISPNGRIYWCALYGK